MPWSHQDSPDTSPVVERNYIASIPLLNGPPSARKPQAYRRAPSCYRRHAQGVAGVCECGEPSELVPAVGPRQRPGPWRSPWRLDGAAGRRHPNGSRQPGRRADGSDRPGGGGDGGPSIWAMLHLVLAGSSITSWAPHQALRPGVARPGGRPSTAVVRLQTICFRWVEN
jgi:hypothetical protein